MTSVALELAACQRRTRWSLAGSFVAHALLLLVLILLPQALPKAPTLTEFTLLDPGELEALAGEPAASAPSRATNAGTLSAESRDESFERAPASADLEPHPQMPDAVADRLASRLATLQDAEAAHVVGVAEASVPGAIGAGTAPANLAGGAGGASAVSLNRGGALGTAPSLTLARGGGTSHSALAANVQPLPAGSANAAPATPGEVSARRTLSGMALAGPIADRPVVSYRKPVYPDWAKRDLVEGSVTLYFIVRPDGSVKENILVQRTAGFEDFDENARAALRAWQFAPLGGGRTGEQWGTITFHFRLQEAG